MKTRFQRFYLALGLATMLIALATLATTASPTPVHAEHDVPPPSPARENVVVDEPSLHNPNFDNHIWYEFNGRYQSSYPVGVWLPAGNTYDDPQDWRLWFLDGTAIVDSEASSPAHSGAESVKMWPWHVSARQVAGLYQEISATTPCLTYKFQMYGYSRQKETSDSLEALRVGIDQMGWHPDSANDPAVHDWPSTMVWGDAQKYTSDFGLLEVTAEALNDKIAVFTYADASGGNSHKIHWDTGSLQVVPRTSNLIDASQPLPSPSGGVYNVTADAALDSASISWDTGTTSTLGQVLYRLLGSGAWQYSSLHTWGTTHQIELTGLQSGSTYEYVVVSYGYADGACKTMVSETAVPLQFETSSSVTAITGVDIEGATTGYVQENYNFIATASPAAATLPITYVWQATGQSPATRVGDLNDTIAFSWSTPGVKTIDVTASNPGGTVADSHTITVAVAGDDYEPDDTCSQASDILTGGTVQVHTFHASDDADWVSFEATSGIIYLIEALVPPDSDADLVVEVYDACGGIAKDGQDNDFSPDVRLLFPASQDGLLYVNLHHRHSSTAVSNAPYRLSVRALDATATPGAVVLVAGKLHDDDPLQSNIHNVTDAVYRFFLDHGYDGSRIYYLATDPTLDPDGDSNSDVDGMPNVINLRHAITQWAESRVSQERPFTLYMMDHGGYDYFYLNGSAEQVSPDEIEGWLDTLEDSVPGVKVNVIVDACKSGSFIDLADTVSELGRVVIASTGAQQLAWATEGGALFSDHFIAAMDRGLSLYSGFEEARWSVEAAQPAQTPWLDDDGDGSPNGTGDGGTAAGRSFAYTGTFSGGVKWPPYVAGIEIGEIVDGRGVITAEVQDDGSVAKVWAMIYPPAYAPPSPDEELVLETIPTVTLSYAGDNTYSAEYTGFSTLFVGGERVVVYAVDDEGLVGRPRAAEGQRRIYLPLIMRS